MEQPIWGLAIKASFIPNDEDMILRFYDILSNCTFLQSFRIDQSMPVPWVAVGDCFNSYIVGPSTPLGLSNERVLQFANTLGKMQNLRYLNLSKVSFGKESQVEMSVLQKKIGELPLLETLNLERVFFSFGKNDFSFLSNLTNLTSLSLRGNDLCGDEVNLADQLANLSKLTYLDLGDTRIFSCREETYSLIEVTRDLPALKYLRLDKNYMDIDNVLKWLINGLASLDRVDLSKASAEDYKLCDKSQFFERSDGESPNSRLRIILQQG